MICSGFFDIVNSMKYLSYKINGFLKKTPLTDESITVGRDSGNHLVIDDEWVSRKHLSVTLQEDMIVVEDLGSKNGFYVNNTKKRRAVLNNGETFRLGNIDFTLVQGSTDEFRLAENFPPQEAVVKDSPGPGSDNVQTSTMHNVLNLLLEEILSEGVKKNNFNEFLSFLSSELLMIPGLGALFLVTRKPGRPGIRFAYNNRPNTMCELEKLLKNDPGIFTASHSCLRVPGSDSGGLFSSFPISLDGVTSALVYLKTGGSRKENREIKDFLSLLARAVEVVNRFFHQPAAKEKVLPPDQKQEEDIIAASSQMRELIQQAKKIAGTDIFILIQGESGTGKELFAKLIHRHSRRNMAKLVALNCAAIPENLLESELFGYEKGAFTGAYAQSKGKLELASGGTLALDEIGDMPLSLQSKLLRALQEQEFYRLGGAAPIKVDLRIISLTHQDLKELIRQNRFRSDLYFRLVHRTLVIPPLRERKEDISALINYYTNKFCSSENKSINGFSVKAMETLLGHSWPGNVRQLENELHSIINLTDDGDMVDYDILSPDIKANEKKVSIESPPPPTPKHYKKASNEEIVAILEKHNWNKSRAAKELGMTYHGLHKKMKNLNIKKPN